MTSLAAQYLARAMLASVGATNPYEKWVVRFLNLNRDQLGTEAVDTLLSYIFPVVGSDATKVVSGFVDFSTQALLQAIGRLPAPMATAFATLRARVKFNSTMA